MLNQDQVPKACFEWNVCQKCGKKCGCFAEYCKWCGMKLPSVLLSESEIEERIKSVNIIVAVFGGHGQSFHSFLREDPEVLFCPDCGENLYPVVVN